MQKLPPSRTWQNSKRIATAFAAKTQEAASNAAEVISETVQVTRERANSALSKENQAKFRERELGLFQEQSAACQLRVQE